jgi:hypothetical protein
MERGATVAAPARRQSQPRLSAKDVVDSSELPLASVNVVIGGLLEAILDDIVNRLACALLLLRERAGSNGKRSPE